MFCNECTKPRILAASSLLSAVSILVFAVPHFIYGGPGPRHAPAAASDNASLTGANASTATVERRPGRRYVKHRLQHWD